MLITTKGRAELMLRTLTTIYGEATYDEVLMMFRDVESFLEHTPVTDVAWSKFFTERNHFIDYLTALNFVHDLNRTEHTVTLHVLIAGGRGDVCELEVTVPIPKTIDKNSKRYLDSIKDYVKALYVATGRTSLSALDYIEEIVVIKEN